jgi:hypothetical protein
VKRTKIVVVAALLGLGLGVAGAAQQAMTVFDIEPGVGMLGAAAAGISIAENAETLYYNPAGLSELPGISFSSFYASYLGQAGYSAFALTFRNWGIAALLLNSTGIQGYDGAGNTTDTLAYRNTGILFGAGIDPSDLAFLPAFAIDMSLGVRLKYLTAKVGEAQATGFTFDLGFRTGFPDMNLGGFAIDDVAIGVTAVNLFGSLAYEDRSDDFLMDIQIGGSGRIAKMVLVALDFHLSGSLHLGFAYTPAPTLALRLGLISKSGVSITAGVGVNVEGFVLDYAYATHVLGGTHRVSLTLDFSTLDMTALSRSLRRLLP